MQPGHPNWMLDTDRDGPLPRWPSSSGRWSAGSSARGDMSRERLLETMRRDCSGLVLSNVQPASAVPFLAAARRLRLPGGRARRELGPHGREGRHLAPLRPLRRPEPRHGGRPAALPRDPARARPRHRLAADRSLPPRRRAPNTRSSCAGSASTLAARSCSSRGTPRATHLRGALRRAPRRVVGARRRRAPPAPVPAAPARPRLAAALRRCDGARRSRRAGGELHRPRRARDAAPALRRRRLQRGHHPPRCARGRPPGRLRALRRGSPAWRVVGGEERRRQALRGARRLRRLLSSGALRGGPRRDRARARAPGRARRGAAAGRRAGRRRGRRARGRSRRRRGDRGAWGSRP